MDENEKKCKSFSRRLMFQVKNMSCFHKTFKFFSPSFSTTQPPTYNTHPVTHPPTTQKCYKRQEAKIESLLKTNC